MKKTNGRKLSNAYFQALTCDESNVFDHFTLVEEIVPLIRWQITIRRALDRAVRKASKLEGEEHQC